MQPIWASSTTSITWHVKWAQLFAGGQESKALLAWYDANGKTVRWNHLGKQEAAHNVEFISMGGFEDHPIWTAAQIGADYDWAGPFGPQEQEPTDSRDEEDDDE
ncbi:hypothetical protein B0T24DRAFT_717152 [Lasiosphaeria ovina]|uniref:Uncharacterized protein n=1 Tax=Lasiosphaeria ovina TaxID=92902 RepID=A0AAE0NDQ4_9PEZI|nr:hypothetical protein B0T24DRAFT_717152 [Lasiosphaeria ovina]